MKLLENLVNTHGIPGREQRVRDQIECHVPKAGLFDEIRPDALGSLTCLRRPRPAGPAPATPTRVLVMAHMDQIGFLVSHVSKDGLLYLQPVGSFDPRTLIARRVAVYPHGANALPGTLLAPGHPVHTAEPEETRKVPEIKSLYVDLSLPAETVKATVRPGDMVVLDAPFAEIGHSAVGGGLDNRVGCWALIRAIEMLSHHDCEICAVWTAQEELGSRGAGPAAFGYEADIGISCDTIVSCDVPGVAEQQRIAKPGDGVSIVIADSSVLSDMSLVAAIEAVARERKIKCQRSLMQGGGQDGALIQRSRRGVRTLVLSCPLKHMHTAVETAHRDDLEAYRDLLAAFLEQISSSWRAGSPLRHATHRT